MKDYVIEGKELPPTASKPMSSDTMTTTTDRWMQFYQLPLTNGPGQALVPSTDGFSDAPMMTESSTAMPSEGILSPTSSHTTSGQLIPKASVSKPIRRRSRASKKTPTTLLNANTANFRALVQQFTGCPSTTMSSLGVHKGPITLNFKQGSRKQIHHDTTRTMPSFGNRSYHYSQVTATPPFPWPKQPEQLLPHQQQLLLQEQQSGYSFDYLKSSDFVPTSGNSRSSMEVSNGLVVGNDFSLHDLTVNAFSNDTY